MNRCSRGSSLIEPGMVIARPLPIDEPPDSKQRGYAARNRRVERLLPKTLRSLLGPECVNAFPFFGRGFQLCDGFRKNDILPWVVRISDREAYRFDDGILTVQKLNSVL